jgi:PBP1b-binding outer membrane lipoprotein LpoB
MNKIFIGFIIVSTFLITACNQKVNATTDVNKEEKEVVVQVQLQTTQLPAVTAQETTLPTVTVVAEIDGEVAPSVAKIDTTDQWEMAKVAKEKDEPEVAFGENGEIITVLPKVVLKRSDEKS